MALTYNWEAIKASMESFCSSSNIFNFAIAINTQFEFERRTLACEILFLVLLTILGERKLKYILHLN